MASVSSVVRRHLRFGWWSLLLFLAFGLALEGFHGFKTSFYLDVSNQTRRLMWTLAHAHGSLLGLVHVVFAVALRSVPELANRSLGIASTSLMAASVLLPGGFFLGGVTIYSGDPGLGIVIVPIGAACLLIAVYIIAKASNAVGLDGPNPTAAGKKTVGSQAGAAADSDYMHSDLQEAIDFHTAIVAEGSKALVGYEREKALANMVLLSEIPTTYDQEEQRQVNAGNLLLRGVPGIGKTFFGVILAAISGAKFARLQGRADLQPTEIVGFQMINPATGEFSTEFGPLASAEVILLDEINRIPLKSQSAFLEGLQDRSITVGKETYQLPAFSFAIATMNPVELGQGTFPLSEAATDRFAIMVTIGYLPPEEEEKLVSFDFKKVKLEGLMSKERVIDIRTAIGERVFLHDALAKYIRRLVAASRPRDPETEWRQQSPSELVERFVDLGGSPRATICWGRLVKVWSLLAHSRDEVYPEDIQELARYVLGHRIWLAPHAAGQGVTVEQVIEEIVAQVPIP